MAEQWINTRNTLSKLRKLLTCSHCLKPLTDPYYIEICKHTFCRACIKNETCPECHIPARSKQIAPNRLFANIMLLTSRLQKISYNEDTNSVPKNDIVDAQSHLETNDKLICTSNKRTAKDTSEIIQQERLEGDTNNSASPTCYSKNSTPRRETLMKVQDISPTTPNSVSRKRNAKGETPLHIACIKGDPAEVQWMLEAGANPNVKDNAGWTPLHEASHHNYLEIVTLLIKHGSFVNTPGYDNETPLHDAVQMDHMDIVSLLVRHGADTNARNARGMTPLDLAKTEEMENALKTTVSISFSKDSTVSANGQENQKVFVLCTGLNRKQKHQLQLCVKMLKFVVLDEFSYRVTHIITDCDAEGQCIRTLKYLQAVLRGKWILNFSWIQLCLEYKRKIDEDGFEVAGTKSFPNSFGARKGRENISRQLPPLFDGCHFYFHGVFSLPWPQRSELSMLVRSGGGNVLKREPRYDMKDAENHRVPYHLTNNSIVNTFVVHALEDLPQFNNLGDNVCIVHVTWLLDSISTFTLLPFNYTP